MANETILPADIYTVYNKTIMNAFDSKLITMLYQPIIGYTAVSLYFTLVDDLDKRELMSEDLTHHHLMATMQLKLDDIVIARRKLEAVGLLKTYLKKDSVNYYVYVLYAPLAANDFLNHPVLNIVLYNNLGKKEYDKIVNYYKVPKVNLKDFKEITSRFVEVFTPVSGNVFIENDNIVNRVGNKIEINSNIDYNLLISSIPKSRLHDKCFSLETRELIDSLSYIYGLDTLAMEGIVRNCLNEKGLIDKIELRKSCRNYYQFENNEKLPSLIYATQPLYLRSPEGNQSNWAKMVHTFETNSPVDYLRSKYKDGEPSNRDLKLLEDLLVDLKLKPGVVNVLIDYVLKVNNQKLNRNYVETIAGQWKRLNIEMVEDAMRISEKEHKKIKKMMAKTKQNYSTTNKLKEEKLPEWFDLNPDKLTVSKEEEEELNKLLDEFV